MRRRRTKFKIFRKRHFIIKKNAAKINFEYRFSNIFLTLLDFKNRVIVCKSSGLLSQKNKKRKISQEATEAIVDSLVTYFKLYRIWNIQIRFINPLNIYAFKILKRLAFRGIRVIAFEDRIAILIMVAGVERREEFKFL